MSDNRCQKLGVAFRSSTHPEAKPAQMMSLLRRLPKTAIGSCELEEMTKAIDGRAWKAFKGVFHRLRDLRLRKDISPYDEAFLTAAEKVCKVSANLDTPEFDAAADIYFFSDLVTCFELAHMDSSFLEVTIGSNDM